MRPLWSISISRPCWNRSELFRRGKVAGSAETEPVGSWGCSVRIIVTAFSMRIIRIHIIGDAATKRKLFLKIDSIWIKSSLKESFLGGRYRCRVVTRRHRQIHSSEIKQIRENSGKFRHRALAAAAQPRPESVPMPPACPDGLNWQQQDWGDCRLAATPVPVHAFATCPDWPPFRPVRG